MNFIVFDPSDDRLIHIFSEFERPTSGAYFWDSLCADLPAWKDLLYEWIAVSQFADQIIFTRNSPIHSSGGIYMHGPDVAGPESNDPNWTDNILYLGPSQELWRARLDLYGDEYSVAPGSLDDHLGEAAQSYREIYRALNPGLTW